MATLVEIGLWNAAAAAVLALLAAAVARLCRRPALAHTLWLLVLLKLLTPPLVPFSLSWPAAEGPAPPAAEERPAPAAEPVAVAEPSPPPVEADEADGFPAESPPDAPAPPPVPWQWWAGAAWLAGSGLWMAWVAFHVIRFRRALRYARPAPSPLRGEAEGLACRLGLWRCPDVWLVDGAVSPMVWALGRRPRLLFPSGLLDRLDGAGRAALLAHELAHLRRRDHWVRLLELAATGLYWWLPVLWWARRELHEAEEQCCDAWGVWALGGDGRPYALALLQAAAFVSHARLPLPAGASGGVGQLSHLKRRLEMVMQGQTTRSLSWAGLGVACGLGLLLPLFPADGQAQQPPDRAPTPAVTSDDQRDKEIADLKRALQNLESQKERERRVKSARDSGALAAEVSVDAQLKEVETAIQRKRKELDELEATARKLRSALKERASRADGSNFNRNPPAAPGTRSAAPAPRSAEGRVDELEKKLDRLQKQLDELQRSLRRAEPVRPQPEDALPRRSGSAAPRERPSPVPAPKTDTVPADRRPDSGSAPVPPPPSRQGGDSAPRGS